MSPRVSRAVGADKPGPIYREADRQRLNRNVVHDLVVASLQERRIDRAKRLEILPQPGPLQR